MKKFYFLLILSGFTLSITAQGPTEIWGITRHGGTGFGALFKMHSDSKDPVGVHLFNGKLSAKNSKTQFHEAGNGKLYTIMDGGAYDQGVIVELDPATGVAADKAHFNSMTTGDFPFGMVLGPNGKFYGTLYNNHTTDKQESVFEYDVTTNTITKKAGFKASTGRLALSEMFLSKNGKLYGVTGSGGMHNAGILYEYDFTTDSIIKKADFENAPSVGLIEYNNKLYSCTQGGGINGGGTIYEYDIAGNTITTKYKMHTMYSRLGLALGNDGLFYGATDRAFFKFDPVSSVFTTIQNFDYSTTGSTPCGIKKCKNGMLYGMLSEGGIYGAGSIYEYDPVKSKFKVVFNFKDTLSGLNPSSVFEQAQNGKLYAGTYMGGKYWSSGVLFEFDMVYHSYKKLHDLRDGLNGHNSLGSLSLADNGKIYTVTPSGGKHDLGILLECDPSTAPGVFTKKFDFNNTSGVHPMLAPVQGPNNKLYGTTQSGGKSRYGEGTIYEYDPVTNSLVTKVYFSDSVIESHNPTGITLASNNKFYGVAFGGKNARRVLYEFDPVTGNYSERAGINEFYDAYMIGELLQAKNGKLYGLLKAGMPGKGGLFEYALTSDTIIVKARFENTNIYTESSGKMVEGPNGKLYGIVTPAVIEEAYLFEYDPAKDEFRNIYTFSNKYTGTAPAGSLLVTANGNLYGMTKTGGKNNRGVIYEYDLKKQMYIKRLDFDGSFGMNPNYHNNLIEVCQSIPYQGSILDTVICENQFLNLSTGLSSANYTFQWYKNEMLIPSATSGNFSISSLVKGDAGIYFCKVSNGCRTIQTKNAFINVLPSSDPDCGVGIKEREKISFEIYPNPVKDAFQVRFDHATGHRVTVELMDVLGKLVFREIANVSETSATLNIGHLTNGVYAVKIQDTNTIFENRKLIKH